MACARLGGTRCSRLRHRGTPLVPRRSPHPRDRRPRRCAAAADRVGIEPSRVHAVLAHAIDPKAYECSPTGLDAFVDSVINGLTDEEFFFLVTHLEMLDIPTYDALLHGTSGDARYAVRSDYRQSLTSTFKDVKGFWDVQSDDIQLMAMHGSMMSDAGRVAACSRWTRSSA